MSNLLLVAYDLFKRESDDDRKAIREGIINKCGDSAQLSESCYVFKSDKTKDEIYAEIKPLLTNKKDKLTVACFDDDAIVYTDSIGDIYKFFTFLGITPKTDTNS